ncbi:MAG: hypothetical protein RIQ60_2685 [Pseudomonadota bacterium]|jgi:hypothetical protein
MSTSHRSAPLGARALSGLRVGISISESPDLDRLGLSWVHLEHAMREVARTLLVSGGTLAFGGDLRNTPDSLTTPMMDEVERYAQAQTDADLPRDRKALWLCLAWHLHRRTAKTALQQTRNSLGQHGSLIYLDPQGQELGPRAQWAGRPPEGAADELSAQDQMQALTGMRRFLARHTHARVLLGGKRLPRTDTFKNGYSGSQPGLVEEALLQLDAGQPIYLAGGFGGITLDMIGRIEPKAAASLTDLTVQLPNDTKQALDQFKAHPGAASWSALDNGLTDDENRRLAHTHRPGEIGALVALGLGRRARALRHRR